MLVAICDDEKVQREQLEHFFNQYQMAHFEIEKFDSGESIVEAYRHGKRYHIVFMDIKLPGINGFEAAKQIKNMDHSVLLIFISKFLNYVLQGYEVNAFQYLVKPLTQDRFDDVITKALLELQAGKEMIYIINTKEDGIIRVNANEIVYLECYGRKITAHLLERNLNYNSSLSEEESKLIQYGFLRVHRSYIINLKYVVQVGQSVIMMKNNLEIPISRRQRKKIMERFTNYLVTYQMLNGEKLDILNGNRGKD